MAFRDAGFVAGMQQAGGAVGKFTTESALGIKTGGSLAATMTNAGKAAIGATLATLGLSGGIAALAVGMTAAIREVGDMQVSLLRLKLAVGGNVESFRELQSIVDASPRGLLFDDNDVARALAVAKTLDATNEEIKELLPSVRGMAAAMGQDLSDAIQSVTLAMETGAVRSLRQYGISLEDVNEVARRFYDAELKDLDETAKRWVIKNAILDKSKLFQNAEIEKIHTVTGFFQAWNVELKENNERLMEWTKNVGLLKSSSFVGGFGLAIQAARGGRTGSIGVGAREPIDAAFLGAGVVTPPGGVAPDPAAIARAAALRARLLGNLEPDRGLYGEEFAADPRAGSASSKFAREQAEKRHKLIREQAEEERALRAQLTLERLQMEEQMEAESWERRSAIVGGLSMGMYNVVSQASFAYYAQEGKRRQSFLAFVGASIKQESAQYILGLGAKAAKEAAFHAIKGFSRAIDPFTAPFAAKEFAAAAKYGAFAASAGLAAGALNASASADFARGEDIANRSAIGNDRTNDQRRGFGLTFTRPIENLTINVAVSISGTNFIGNDQENTMEDVMERYAVPAIRTALDTGKLAA